MARCVTQTTKDRALSTFIAEFSGGTGIRVAVKDLIDMAGVPTTAGCRAVADRAPPADSDAACLTGIRAAERAGEARIVGRTNLHELAFGITGVNPWFGTPVNPLDADILPGGSSSGSAVAVGSGDADIAIGTDTGGSLRIPAACCGVAGLKTTFGRIPLRGVWPLAPTLDTVGPIAATAAGLEVGMSLLESGFHSTTSLQDQRVGRVRLGANPDVDDAIDTALMDAGFTFTDVDLPGWASADRALLILVAAEAWAAHRTLVLGDPEGVGADVAARVRYGGTLTRAEVAEAEQIRRSWIVELEEQLTRFSVLALPTLRCDPPRLNEGRQMGGRVATRPVNLAGVPAVVLPIPRAGKLPASLQLIGPSYSEEQILAVALTVEEAVSQ